MLPDRTEHSCQVIDMSPGNVSIRCVARGQLGDRVVAYLDHVGRVEGVITRLFEDGFAMSLVASERKREKLAAQLTWLANKHELDLPEDRRHERIAPSNPISVMQLADGRQYECRLIDLSLSGAAVETQVRPGAGRPGSAGYHARTGRPPFRRWHRHRVRCRSGQDIPG